MAIVLGFAPFILFVLLSSVSVSLGLWLAFAAAFVITVRDFVESPTLRLLDAGSMFLFGLLALFTGFVEPSLSLEAVRLLVEAGFLILALLSMLRRRPLTLQYGHEHVPEKVWNTPAFVRANYVLTTAWAVAFAAMAAADAVATFDPKAQLSLDIAVGLAALALAIAFTVRYPTALAARSGLLDIPARSKPANKS